MKDNYQQVEQREDHKDYKEYRQLRRTIRNPWFWVVIATLIIIPFIFFTWLSHDNYIDHMVNDGCYLVNVFDNGTEVFECKDNR